ncbi:MAG: DUF1573 domain-containing protein [Bacteroidota bacterium]|nr:DUF1573 domain-containing protein [Bacteroidota bacterium]
MKAYFFIIATLLLLGACKNLDVKRKDVSNLASDTAKFTNIKWIDSLKDIGAVEAGKKTAIQFRFKNIGKRPLFVISAQPGCGCTVADYPKEAIAPGDEGIITAGFTVNAGTTGDFRKNIHVTTNTNGSTSHYIYFYGVIKSAGDTLLSARPDSNTLNNLQSKELKRNLLLKPNKN